MSALDPSEWPAFLAGLRFAWPWVLILIPAPLLWSRFTSTAESGSGRHALPVPPVLSTALLTINLKGHFQPGFHRWLYPLCWLALIIALAQPERPGAVVVTPASGRAVVLAVDLSGSMERTDFSLDGIKDNRLRVVQRVATQFIRQRNGDRVGLVVFGKEAFSATPLTFDLNSVADTLRGVGIGMTGRSTAIGDAIGLALTMLREDPASQKAIVLLSDGTNNAGSVEPESAATLAQSLGVRIHTIALGSDQIVNGGYSTAPSADLDEKTLEAIASSAEGVYFRARTTEELLDIYTTIDELESAETDAPPSRPAADLRHWPLIALFLLLLVGVWRESRT